VEVLDPLQCPVLDEQHGEEHVEAVGRPEHHPRRARTFTPTGKDRRRAGRRGVSLLAYTLSLCVWCSDCVCMYVCVYDLVCDRVGALNGPLILR
jgi:hypothetical protein